MQVVASPSSPPATAAPVAALREDGSVDPVHEGALTRDLAVALYEHMVLSRAVDERFVEMQREGTIAQHASATGEEATILGAAAAMSEEDWIFPGAREFAAALWRGMPLLAYAHHVLGTASDVGAGRNAPGSPFWRAAKVASVSPIVGASIPHAVGAAWAARIRKARAASLVFFGEEATSTGDFHSGLNFAGVTRAPVVAVCRSGAFATSAPAARQTASPGFAIKALAYGLRGVTVDGTDVVAVLSVVRDARARAVAGEGGTLVEAVFAGGEKVDPIARMRQHLVASGLVEPEIDQRLAADIAADVERALAEAAKAAPPARSTMFEDVYAAPPWHLVEQRDAR